MENFKISPTALTKIPKLGTALARKKAELDELRHQERLKQAAIREEKASLAKEIASLEAKFSRQNREIERKDRARTQYILGKIAL